MQKYDIKLIAIDLDGTLCYHHGEFIEKNLPILKKALKNNIKVVLSTGRPFYITMPVVKKYQLVHHNDNEFIVTYTGASIFDLNLNKEIKRFEISLAKIKQIWVKAKQLNIQIWGYQTNEIVVTNKNDFEFCDFDFLVKKHTQKNIEVEEDGLKIKLPFYKAIVKKSKNEEVNLKWINFLNEIKINYYGENQDYYEITNGNISKGKAVEWIANHLNISLENVMSIGDSYNDLSMFEVSKISVAMKDGFEIAKQKATFISKVNHDQGGVESAIKQFVKLPL